MRYPIGDVARALGLTPGALHFFEREGVITPDRAEGQSHRTYGVEDVIRLISYRKYRAMDVPVKEIAQQFSPSGNTHAQIADKLADQRETALEAARRYQRLADDIRWYEQAAARATDALGRFDIRSSPDCYTFTVGEDGLLSKNKDEQRRIATWLDALPATRLCALGSEGGAARFGYMADALRAEELGLHEVEGACRHLPQAAVHTFLNLEKAYYDTPEMAFEPLWHYLREHGFTQAGEGVAISICVSCMGDRRDTLTEVFLPFR